MNAAGPLSAPISNADVPAAQLDELERRVEAANEEMFDLCLRRAGRGDWEARTLSGDVGRGDTLAAAIADLLPQLPAGRG